MKKLSLLGLAAVTMLSGCQYFMGTESEVDVPTIVVDPSEAEAHVIGNDDAPITIMEFSDLQCPACAATIPLLMDYVENNPEKVRMEAYHFPLTSIHQYAFLASEASECAADQGEDSYWAFKEMIYTNQDQLNEDYVNSVADSLELDREAFDQCLEDGTHKEKVQTHMALGEQMGVGGTPTIFVDGQIIRWPGATEFDAYIDSLL